MASFLGIDLGTSATKVGVFDDSGACLALSSAPCAISRPAPGWFEQNPEDWWESVVLCLRRTWELGIDPESIDGIGLSGHFSTAFLDEDCRPARPAITWQDARAEDEAEELAERVTPDSARALL